ncbi:hypothetical protein PSN13_02815 [Micromonospora saelicesensis]|uniref:Uncharacterized protein n=1 Tax=Micromonospora saelicesensis TaxID=285676 RepID=A0A328NKX5_9ACTN|nr:hypothetical protein [Micromonospora saelicesensis]RAO33948.1 hypothetical protein PSN13_02815 [Micromonospora saelicesensis]
MADAKRPDGGRLYVQYWASQPFGTTRSHPDGYIALISDAGDVSAVSHYVDAIG